MLKGIKSLTTLIRFLLQHRDAHGNGPATLINLDPRPITLRKKLSDF